MAAAVIDSPSLAVCSPSQPVVPTMASGGDFKAQPTEHQMAEAALTAYRSLNGGLTTGRIAHTLPARLAKHNMCRAGLSLLPEAVVDNCTRSLITLLKSEINKQSRKLESWMASKIAVVVLNKSV